jgi:hypothetical protein
MHTIATKEKKKAGPTEKNARYLFFFTIYLL